MFKKIPCLLLLVCCLHFAGCESFRRKVESDALPDRSDPRLALEISPKSPGELNYEKTWKDSYQKTLNDLDRNRQKWRSQNIADYDFVIAKDAPGTTSEWMRLPVLIKVKDGKADSIEKVDKDKDYVIFSRTDGFEDFDSIDKLFDFIRRDLDGGKIFEIRYDERFGYPQKVVETTQCCVNHNYRMIMITKFEIIKVNPDNRKL